MFGKTLFSSLAPIALNVTAHAGEGVPVTVDLSEVEARPGKLYISIQTEDQYQGIRGAGGIIEIVTPGMTSATYEVAAPSTYAVSLWHDLDDDGVFSLTDDYQVLDGWGASGTLDPTRRPVFSDVAIDVPAYGAEVAVGMFYPGG